MTYTLLNTTEDLDKNIKRWQIDNDESIKTKAIIKILEEYFKNNKGGNKR